MTNADWMKQTKKLQADLDNGHKTFLQFGTNGSGMIKDKTMGVSNDMVQASKQAEDGILNHMKYISEVVILATPVHLDDFGPSA